jgi:hypothetical protein
MTGERILHATVTIEVEPNAVVDHQTLTSAIESFVEELPAVRWAAASIHPPAVQGFRVPAERLQLVWDALRSFHAYVAATQNQDSTSNPSRRALLIRWQTVLDVYVQLTGSSRRAVRAWLDEGRIDAPVDHLDRGQVT